MSTAAAGAPAARCPRVMLTLTIGSLMTATLFTALLATLLAVLPAPRAAAQRVGTVALPFVTGETAERRRLGELVGDSAGPFTLLRAASRQLDTKARGWSVGIVMPEARVV